MIDNPGDNFLSFKRFGDIINRTKIQAFDFMFNVI